VTVPLTPRDAAIRILTDVCRQPALRVPLDDALDGVLAETIISPIDIPAWSNSAMDGYAARAEDVRGATPASPRRLRVIENIPAGAFPTLPLEAGTCARIFTGAPVPAGADSVIRQEDTDRGAQIVAIVSDRDAGMNIRRTGEDIRRGSVVLEEGSELGPAAVGVLASLAVAKPMIYRRPRVGILGSGDEIVDIDQPDQILAGRKVASSNTHTLAALVRHAGGEPVSLGIAEDTSASLRAHLARASECDLLVTTAGISVGEHDQLRSVMAELGAGLKFWRLRMRPGAPVGFGALGALPWIGLPGNPVSTMVTFELFGRPAIRKLAGHQRCFRRAVTVRLAERITASPGLQHFFRATLTPGPGTPEARLTGPQGSGVLTSMLRADALLIVPEGTVEVSAGTELSAIVLNDPVHQEDAPF
jgi:molybdopterin molybdotransferase